MAINQTDKQLNIVDRLVTQATLLDEALEEAQSLIDQFAQAGQLVDATLENSALKHINANDVVTLNYRFSDLLTWFGAEFRRDILRKVRK